MVFLYILCAALSWSALSFLRKVTVSVVPNPILIVLMAAGGACVSTFWAVLSHDTIFYVDGYLKWAALSILCNIVSNYLFLESLKRGDLNQTIPFLALVPVIALFMSIFIGEYATPVQVIGVFLVCIGGFFLSADTELEGSFLRKRISALWKNKGGLYMLAVAFLFGSVVVIDKKALTYTTTSVHAMMVTYAMFLFYSCYCLAKSSMTIPQVFKRIGVKIIFIPLFSGSAILFTLVVIQMYPVALYEAIAKCSDAILSLVLGSLLLNEKVRLQQVSAVLVMCVGVLFVLL